MQHFFMTTDAPIIFDVGAHHGLVSKKFRELFPKATIYAFEPFIKSFEQLKVNICSDKGIHVFNFGLSEKVGSRLFHCNSSSATNSILATDVEGAITWEGGILETQDVVSAKFETVDSVVAAMQIPRIDILKLDVQGAEPLVITGAEKTIHSGKIALIYSEIITQPTYSNQKRFDRALEVFYDSGYDLYNIYNLNNTRDGRLRQVDAIFTKQDDRTT